MNCHACARFLLCNKKECNFKRIRDVEVIKISKEENKKREEVNELLQIG